MAEQLRQFPGFRSAKPAAGRSENRLDQLADELISSGLLDQAHGAAARRIKTADFLTARLGGYPPSVRTVTLLTSQIKNGKPPAQRILPLWTLAVRQPGRVRQRVGGIGELYVARVVVCESVQ